MSHETVAYSRRRWLHQMLFGFGCLGLRSAISGIPRAVLAAPERFVETTSPAQAEVLLASSAAAQYLVLSTSDMGDPLNCNVPGTYEDANIRHPTGPSMVATTFTLGQAPVKAALAWSQLTPSLLGRLQFFHGKTGFNAHGGLPSVQALGGLVADNEMMASGLAKVLAGPLGTIQSVPVMVSGYGGSEMITASGQPQPSFTPTGIRDLLTVPSALASFQASQSLRDRDLDRLHALVKAKGVAIQQQLVDSWVSAQSQARAIAPSVVAQLSAISDNSTASQMTVAAMLCQLKLSPVIIVHLPFGGDNHTDADPHNGAGALPGEAGDHVASVGALNNFVAKLATVGLQDKVTFATLTTFGRTNAGPDLGGRAHNGAHCCNLLSGANVRAGVTGGVQLTPSDLLGMDIDSQTGAAMTGGDITANNSLASYGKTVARACGLTAAQADTLIPTGKVVASALA